MPHSHASFDTDIRPPRYECLDLWRGVACLMVVLLHAGHYAKHQLSADAAATDPLGYAIVNVIGRFGLGVQLFFVTSGYCIAATVDAARRKRSAGWDFFTRRFRRIFPPYWAALGITALVLAIAPVMGVYSALTTADGNQPALIPPLSELSLSQWIGNVTLTEHWRWHFIGDPELKLLGPAWTLCYEEQFYAVCGLLLLAAPCRFFLGVVAVTIATLALLVAASLTGQRVPSGLFCDGRWLLFAAGVFVYAHEALRPGWRRYVVPLLLIGSVGFAAWLRYVHLRGSADLEQRQLAFECCFGSAFSLVLLSLRSWDRRLAALTIFRPLAICGQMCYSLYLIHWPIALLASIALYRAGIRGVWPTLLVTIPVVTSLCLITGWLFHLAFERRFLNPPHGTAEPPVSSASESHQSETPVTLRAVQYPSRISPRLPQGQE